jgi:Papain-like cysteine protease AvrRpt2
MGDPTAVARFPDQLDVFWTGGDGRVGTSWWNASTDWGGPRSIGGFFPANGPVSSVARSPNNLDLFMCGNDGRVYTSWWFSGADWSGVNDNWRSIGGFFPAGAPVGAVSRTPDNLDLFICGNDGRVYTSWWFTGADWSGVNDNWRSIGGFFPPGAPVTAVSRHPDHLDVFVCGNDGRVYTSWWHAGSDWSGINDNWRSIGGFFPPAARVAPVARTPDNLDLFITGNDGRVYTSWWFSGADWSGINDNWRSIGGFFPPGAPLGAVARTGGNLDVFVSGNDGRIYTSWWFSGADWSGVNDNWRSIGGFFPPGAPVSAVARYPNHLDLFVRGNDNAIYSSWWDSGSDWSGIYDNWFVVPPSIRLNFNMEMQQQSNWCWAATSKSVAAYYDPATTWTQCRVADAEKGQTTCCVNGASAACNAYGTLDTSLTTVGHLDHMVGAQVPYSDVIAQMRAGRPVGARTAWSGGGAHFVCLIGTLAGDMYAVDDPISGKSDVTEAAFKTSYLASGTWTHTYFTR